MKGEIKWQKTTRHIFLKLYVLLPYYILRYEKQLLLIEKEESRRQQFLEEYDDICDRLITTLGKENPLAYSELHKLMKRVQEYVLKKRENIRKFEVRFL